MTKSKIAWTEEVWNPVTGCTKISAGCENCYAERMSLRWQRAQPEGKYRNGFQLTLHDTPHYMNLPIRTQKPKVFFVNSMSDLFHKDIPDEFILKVFGIMRRVRRHTFLVLTKRSRRLEEMASELHWTKNIWIGVSVETPKYYYRIDHIRNIPATVRFLSLEPLLAAMPDIPLCNIDWVITGGESGPNARKMELEWAQEIRDQCIHLKIPFFHKQHGGKSKCKCCKEWGCCKLDGVIWHQKPVIEG